MYAVRIYLPAADQSGRPLDQEQHVKLTTYAGDVFLGSRLMGELDGCSILLVYIEGGLIGQGASVYGFANIAKTICGVQTIRVEYLWTDELL